LQACIAGKINGYFPDPKSVKCDDVTWLTPQASPIFGWSVPYYIVPLWYEQFDHSRNNLNIELSFRIDGTIESLSVNRIFIIDAVSNDKYVPLSIQLISDGSYKTSHFLTYRAEFNVPQNKLDKFELHFSEAIYGCLPPPIIYTKAKESFNGGNR